MKKNLLPNKYNKGPVYEILKGIFVANVILGAFFASWYGLYHFKNAELQFHIGSIEQKIEDEKKEVSDKEVLLKTDELYQALIEKKSKKESGELQVEKDLSYNSFVQKVNSVTPKKIRLTTISYLQEGDVLLAGQSTDFKYVSDFYRGLIKESIIAEGQLQKVEVIPSVEGGNYANKEVVYFEIKGGEVIEAPE